MTTEDIIVFEDALCKTGWGSYNRCLKGFMGFCMLVNALTAVSGCLALSLASCTMATVEPMFLAINVCYIFGLMVGGVCLGLVADLVDRTRVITATIALTFTAAFVAGFALQDWTFLICGFLLGLAWWANVATIKVHFAEVLGTKTRGRHMVCLEVFWSAGFLLAVVVSWGVGMTSHVNHSAMVFVTWRSLFGLGSVLCLFTGALTGLLQSGPRALASRYRPNAAAAVLRFMYAVNYSRHSDELKLRSQDLVDSAVIARPPASELHGTELGVWSLFSRRRCNFLVHTCLRTRVVLIACLLRVALSAGRVGALAFALKATEHGCRRRPVTGAQFLHVVFRREDDCFGDGEEPLVLWQAATVIAGNIAALVLLMGVVDRIGRRLLIGCGLACVALPLSASWDPVSMSALATVLVSSFTVCDVLLDIVVIENVPTLRRVTALGLSRVLAGTVWILCILTLNAPCHIVANCAATVMFASAILSTFLPERSSLPMVE